MTDIVKDKEVLRKELYDKYYSGEFAEENKSRIDFVLDLREKQLALKNKLEKYILDKLAKRFENIQYQVPIPILENGGKLEHIYLADILVNNTNIVEIDGNLHKDRPEYDKNRDRLTTSAGYTTYRMYQK